jgi:hypothetical protein
MKSIPSPTPEGVDAIRAEMTKLAPTFADWRKTTMTNADAKITRLKADKGRDTTDDQVLRDLGKSRAGLKKIMDAEAATLTQLGKLDARRKQSKPLSVDEAKLFQLQISLAWLGLNVALAELADITGKAYEAYPHEADAYAAQHAVMKEFGAKNKAAGRP